MMIRRHLAKIEIVTIFLIFATVYELFLR